MHGLFPPAFLLFERYIRPNSVCVAHQVTAAATLLHRRGKVEETRRVWESKDARSAACNHGEMLHVALVIQACVHVAVVIHTCLLLPRATTLRGRKMRVSTTILWARHRRQSQCNVYHVAGRTSAHRLGQDGC